MYDVHIMLQGPWFARRLQEHSAWLEERGIDPIWEADDIGPAPFESIEKEADYVWGMTFTFNNKNDAMLFRLARA